MEAKCRDDVFATLRTRGIKAIKVVAADGSKANGEVRGLRKRVVAAVTLAVAVLAGGAAYLLGERQGGSEADVGGNAANSSPRHQIYGDPAIVNEFERGKFEDVLPRVGDQLLAWFAQPGKLMCPKNTPQFELRRLNDARVSNLQEVAAGHIEVAPTDPREAQELKLIVNGLRDEMNEYLANGNGTIRSFWRRLLERTQQEAQIYERTRRELEKETNPAIWAQKNEALRILGLRTIPNPRDNE